MWTTWYCNETQINNLEYKSYIPIFISILALAVFILPPALFLPTQV